MSYAEILLPYGKRRPAGRESDAAYKIYACGIGETPWSYLFPLSRVGCCRI